MLPDYINPPSTSVSGDETADTLPPTAAPYAKYSELVGKPIVVFPSGPTDVPIPHLVGEDQTISEVRLVCPYKVKMGRKWEPTGMQHRNSLTIHRSSH